MVQARDKFEEKYGDIKPGILKEAFFDVFGMILPFADSRLIKDFKGEL